MNLWIVIPAYNEERKLPEVIQNLKKAGYQNLIVVDDGSSDATYSKAKDAGTIALRHIINRGQGAALQTGISFALEQGADTVITFDADGQHSPEDIPKLLAPLNEKTAEIVVGSRFLEGKSQTPPIRKIILKGGALLFRTIYGMHLTDSHNGLRALSRKAAEKIKITQDGMEHASEIIELTSKYKLPYKEVPVLIQYTDYSISHGQKTSNAFRILFKMMIKWLTR